MTLFLPWLIAALAARVGVAAQQETCHESDSDCVGAASRSLLQRKQMAAEQATTVAEVDLATAFSKLTDVASQLKGEVEQLKEGLEVEHAEVLTLRHMLSESNEQKVDSGKHVHVHAETDEKDQSFELCRAGGNTLGQVEVQDNQSLYEGTSCGSSEVLLFSPKDSSPYFETQCCPISKEHCAGCAKQNSAKTSCSTCRGGFTRTSAGNCLACVDLPWENKAGQNCVKASCSDEKFNGFSSNEACCKCGAGQKAATSFAYYVGPLALGSSSVVGHPVPRTASHYSVDKDCELAKYGLMINPSTGALGLISGCSTVGCGAQKSIEVRCTVTAEQEDGLTASAPLEVLAGGIGYGSVPVVLRGTTKSSAPVVTSTGSSGSYKISCAPSASSWLNIDSSGKLALKSGQSTGAGGVTGSDGKMGEGGVCSVQKGTAKGSVVVVAPTTWSSLSYSYGSRLLYVTVGEKSPILSPTKRTGVKPTRFSADCKGSAFTFDVLSGIATWEGHQIFSLNTATGDLQLSPEEPCGTWPRVLDKDVGLEICGLGCKKVTTGHVDLFASIDFDGLHHLRPLRVGSDGPWPHFDPPAEHGVPGPYLLGLSQPQLRQTRDQGGVCTDSSNFACKYKNIGVLERYPGCGERNGCMHLELKGHHYLSGRYCPGGAPWPR
ncbi:unnamed protein product [Symbiodinium natans]|uniref:Uncharacterized protein n=1 Tax=Symbiodinium natans TaxID=878477 RepID=A0A812RZE8_9DINO|nr:unnamed protein product [Symbiodinium natans]